MNREELIKFMEEHHFELWATMKNGEDVAYQFVSSDYVDIGKKINCTVDLKDNTFEFRYAVPYTVFTLNSGKHSPITNEKHFYKTYRRFMRQVRILAEENNI